MVMLNFAGFSFISNCIIQWVNRRFTCCEYLMFYVFYDRHFRKANGDGEVLYDDGNPSFIFPGELPEYRPCRNYVNNL